MSAIVAIDEVGHWLVSALYLNLDEARALTSAIFTLEHALVLGISFDDLSVPISALIPQSLLLSLLSFLLQLLRRQLAHVHVYELLWRDLTR